MNHPFRALRHRDFGLFVLGQSAGILGYWIQQLAVHWLMYRMTGSALMIGATAFAAQIPVLVLGPIAGAAADRIDRHRAFVLVQSLQLVQAVAMTLLAYLQLIEPWHMIALTIFLGMTIAVELPVRHAYLPELLGDREDLPNAVAVTSLVGAAGRLVGPSIAGVMIGLFSEASCFALNALSFVVVLATLAAIRRKPHAAVPVQRPMWKELSEGALHAWRSRPIRALLLVLATVSFMATPYQPLMPAFVAQAYQGGPETLGFFVAAAGLGALAGTLYLSLRAQLSALPQLIARAALCAGCALLGFALTRWYVLSFVLLAVTGFAILAVTVSVSMMLQATVEDRMRGRLMSLYTAAFLGVAPLGGLAAGALADLIGASHTLALGGLCCAAAGLALTRSSGVLDLGHPGRSSASRAGSD
jgi:MFS family permease